MYTIKTGTGGITHMMARGIDANNTILVYTKLKV